MKLGPEGCTTNCSPISKTATFTPPSCASGVEGIFTNLRASYDENEQLLSTMISSAESGPGEAYVQIRDALKDSMTTFASVNVALKGTLESVS